MPSSPCIEGRRSPACPGGSAVLTASYSAALLGVLCASCLTPDEYHAQADDEVYALVDERREALFGDGPGFSIDPPTDSLRARLLAGEAPDVGDLDLVESLLIASENSREYRSQREAVYLAALDLTLERWRFSVQENGSFGALFTRTGPDEDNLVLGGEGGLSRLLGSGALIVGNVGFDLFRNLANADDWNVIDDLGLTITQPLLRGFGKAIVQEPLTQAERDVVYQVRTYERFRRSFAVDVAGQLYRILQQRDVVANERSNIDNLQLLRKRNEELAAAGRLSDLQVDQALQDELRSRDRLISQEQRYQGLLDEFKLLLGLPVESPVDCDAVELERLVAALEVAFELPEEELVELALRERLDYRTTLDRIADAERKVVVAADALRAALNVVAGVDLRSEEGRPLDVSNDSIYTLGLDLDLPLNRLPERNVYRAAEIRLQAARREGEQQADRIRATLRALLRETAATREIYEIQRNSEALGERRVESARMRLDAGRADTRDILEAQEDLRDAQNAVTAALIDYRLAQLAALLDLEVLRVDEDGFSVEASFLERLEIEG